MKNTRTKFLYAFTFVVFFCFGMTGIVNADSLYFNGVDSRVQIPDSPRLSGGPGRSLTFEAWIYPAVLPTETNKHIVSKYLGWNDKDWGLFIDTDGFVAFQKEGPTLPGCSGGNWYVWSSEAIQGNKWSHVAFVFDNDNDIVKVYINGVLKGSKEFLCDLPDTHAVVWIGGPGPFYYFRSGAGIFDGCIDEVRIWDKARTDNEISDNMSVGSITGAETGLVAFFDFSPGADPTILYDLSGNSNDGEVFAASWSSVCPNYRDVVTGDGPFAYYRLGESAVTDPVIDEIGNHHGSCQNSPTVGATGALLSDPANNAMCFDSSQSQYIELTTLGDFGSRFPEGFTDEYWLMTNDPNNHQTILGVANSDGYLTDFLVDIAYNGNTGGLRIYFRDDHWKRYSAWFFPEGDNINIYDGAWHHIVHVYDPSANAVGDRVIYYVDGVRQTIQVNLLSDVPPYESSNFNHPMTLGAMNKRGSIMYYLNGCLDEVAFYTRPLTEEEVLSHYQAATSPDTDGDGIPDSEDTCPTSDLSPTVVIDGCDSGVENELFDNGCTISDIIAELASTATNHGEFTSAVAHYTNDLKKDGDITGNQKGAIQSCVGQAGIP